MGFWSLIKCYFTCTVNTHTHTSIQQQPYHPNPKTPTQCPPKNTTTPALWQPWQNRVDSEEVLTQVTKPWNISYHKHTNTTTPGLWQPWQNRIDSGGSDTGQEYFLPQTLQPIHHWLCGSHGKTEPTQRRF